MKNSAKNILKFISVPAGIFLIVILFLMGGFINGEGYNFVNPFADTEMAPGYSPEKFKFVKEGMHMKEVKELIGEPMNTDKDSLRVIYRHSYTRDGYLLRRDDKRLSLLRDIAWFGSTVEYNTDSIAVKVFSGWYYD